MRARQSTASILISLLALTATLVLVLVETQLVAALTPLFEMVGIVLALPTVERVLFHLAFATALVVVPPRERKRLVLVKGWTVMPGCGILRESRRRKRGDQGKGEQ